MNILDGISPELAKFARNLMDKGPLLRGAAGIIAGFGDRAFGEPSVRPGPWAPKKDGSEATLRGNPPILMRSLKVKDPSATSITIGSDRPYARAHQFGNPKGNLPARPFLPFGPDKQLAPFAARDVREELERQLIALLPK